MSEKSNFKGKHVQSVKAPISREIVAENIARLTGGNSMTIENLKQRSPVKIPMEEKEQTKLFLSRLYSPDEKTNIVTQFELGDEKGRPKCAPRGPGRTLEVAQWLNHIDQNGAPHGPAGAWMRINPVGPGSGSGGTITDRDVVNFRYVLVEADAISIADQLSLLAHIALPIVALTLSGSRSVHALVRVNSTKEAGFRETCHFLFNRLRALGVDTANRNPSRLTRLPGAMRVADVETPALQELIYFNPSPNGNPIINPE